MAIKLLMIPLIIGIYLIFKDGISYLLKDISLKFKALKRLLNKSRLERHIERIFMVISSDQKEKRDKNLFYCVTVLLFAVASYFLVKMLGNTGMLLCLVITAMPYIYIRATLVLKQRSGSFEGEAFLREIFTQYKRCNRNIITTIDETVKSLSDNEPVTKRALFRVSLRVKSIKTDEELKDLLADFIYALNTNWSRMLADNLYSAIRDKTDIQAGLQDLYEGCKKINKKLEISKRDNLEAAGMMKFLGPIFIALFAYMGAQTMEVKKMIAYQFNTKTGVLLFCLILLSFVIGNIIINLATKQKYD
ncbi:MAG: hypothetical protein PHE79_11245 [Eubacteriales bacterium]|nr:hypothetical protein [Eubacteriales bacterium]